MARLAAAQIDDGYAEFGFRIGSSSRKSVDAEQLFAELSPSGIPGPRAVLRSRPSESAGELRAGSPTL
jgi:hypothetical protein